MTTTNKTDRVPVSDLLLDAGNPRFGGNLCASENQSLLLESIIEQHGVNDLLASMSSNGYFDAEPVVAVEKEGRLTVVEGNRRLAAASILIGDLRARQQLAQFGWMF